MKKLLGTSLSILLAMFAVTSATYASNLSKVDKAKAVIQSFQTGKITALKDYVNQDHYIQHNLSFPNGLAPVIKAVQSGAFKGTLVKYLPDDFRW